MLFFYAKLSITIFCSLKGGQNGIQICVSDDEWFEEVAAIILSAFDFINNHAHIFCMDNQIWIEEDRH